MPAKNSPFVESKYGWSFGESGWNVGVDENFIKFGFLHEAVIDGIVSALPPAVNGSAYFLTTDSRVYFVVDNTYYSSPVPDWFEFKIRSTGQLYYFNGSELIEGALGAITPEETLDLLLENDNVNIISDSEKTLIAALNTPQAANSIPYDSSINYSNGSIGQSLKTVASLKTQIEGGDYLTADWVKVKVNSDAETRTITEYLNRSSSVFLSDYFTQTDLQAAKAGTLTDATAGFVEAINKTLSKLPCTLFIDEGIYPINQTLLPNLAKTGLKICGKGVKETKLKLTAAGVGLNFNAFEDGLASTPFAQIVNLENFTVDGNNNVTYIIDAQGLARCHWKNINVMNANSTSGVGFRFRGFMLSRFEGIYCSTDLQAMTSVPLDGIQLDEGRRATISVGHSSNNTFVSCYFEGLPIGMRLIRADQNTFIGGSPESCTTYGMIVGSPCRYNTFMGMGFENLGATGDVVDSGISSSYINCYSSNAMFLQGRDCTIKGGYFERIELQSDSSRCIVGSVTVNHWNTGRGGFFDSGTGTRYGSVFDSQTQLYVYPKKSRVSVTPSASPFTFRNTFGVPIEVIIQGGTVTQIRKGDGAGDLWLTGNLNNGSHILLADDLIEISYSAAPAISRRTLNSI